MLIGGICLNCYSIYERDTLDAREHDSFCSFFCCVDCKIEYFINSNFFELIGRPPSYRTRQEIEEVSGEIEYTSF